MSDEQQMIEAIKAGDLQKVRDLIETDIFLADARADDGTSALLTAIYHGEEEIAEVILESAPTLDIHEAAAAGMEDRVMELIEEEKGKIDEISHDGWAPLHLAVYFNRDRVAERLIRAGANLNVISRNPMGVAPLHSALSNRNVHIAQLLLQHGANPTAVSAAGYTALHYAAANELKELVPTLLERGVPIDAKTNDGKTAAELAKEKGWEMGV